MSFDPTPFDFLAGLQTWLIIMGACLGIVLVVALLTSLVAYGLLGPARVFGQIREGVGDLFRFSFRRTWALTVLTFKEAVRRKALWVGAVFAILFMFAGWFISDANARPDLQVKVYVSIVLTAIGWLIIPVVLLLACWGVPQDIKARSLHTVVTKPARRHEIVLGRMLGFIGIGTLVLAVFSAVGFAWICRQMLAAPIPFDQYIDGRRVVVAYPQGEVELTITDPDGSEQTFTSRTPDLLKQQSQEAYRLFKEARWNFIFSRVLTARVPIYGGLKFLDREGEPSTEGINVGDPWQFRSYIEGATNARAIWTFENVTPESMIGVASGSGSQERLVLESNFEAFRTHKGEIDESLLCEYLFVNEEKDLQVSAAKFQIHEYEGNVTPISRKLTYYDEQAGTTRTVDVFDDLVNDGKLTVHVRCLNAGQYLGMARPDLFIRTPDRPFAASYFTATLGVWLLSVVIISVGVAASCFVKGPVAMLLLFVFVVVGTGFHDFMDQLVRGEVEGSGTIESAVRLVQHHNPKVQLEETAATEIMHGVDPVFRAGLWLVSHIIPDLGVFQMAPYAANGFAVPWRAAVLPSVAITLAYLIPCLLIGYYSLKLRELESK